MRCFKCGSEGPQVMYAGNDEAGVHMYSCSPSCDEPAVTPGFFRIECRKKVRAKDFDAWLNRRIELPFIPTVGMSIVSDSWSIEVTEVEWSYDEGFLYVVDKKLLTDKQTLAEVRRQFPEWNGWDRANPVH